MRGKEMITGCDKFLFLYFVSWPSHFVAPLILHLTPRPPAHLPDPPLISRPILRPPFCPRRHRRCLPHLPRPCPTLLSLSLRKSRSLFCSSTLLHPFASPLPLPPLPSFPSPHPSPPLQIRAGQRWYMEICRLLLSLWFYNMSCKLFLLPTFSLLITALQEFVRTTDKRRYCR